MATGDITWFNEAKAYMLDGGWEAADDIKLAIITNGTVPSAGTVTPTLSDFTQVFSSAATSYTAGGTSVGTWGALITQSGGTVTFDSATNPTWTQDPQNSTNAYYGVLYNDTDAADQALFFVELGGPVNMATGSLTVTWNVSGMATLV